ncbi:MAG: hypothetical protein LBR79_07305 [Oscillospiraceae bacterium]|nr:hypothetical protein [Oscillospiraceae bacterium]
MAVFCVGTIYVNYVEVNLINGEKVTSSIGNDIFEYQSTVNTFSVRKNGNLVGIIPTSKKNEVSSK